jgi:hypothetical protein
MANSSLASIVVSILVPIATALIGILGIVFQDWWERRSRAGRRKLALEHAKLQVSFATEWLTAQKLITDSPKEELNSAATLALKWLKEASTEVEESEALYTIVKQRITIAQLLLSYPLHGAWAKFLRILFYVSFFFFAVGAIAFSSDVRTGDYGSDIAIAVTGVFLMLVFRFGAIEADHHSGETSGDTSHMTPTSASSKSRP